LEYSSTKYSVSGNISVRNIQSVDIFQYKILSQWEYSSTKYLLSQWEYSSTKYSASGNIPVQNTQSVGIFQYQYSVSRNITVRNSQSVGIFQFQYSVCRNIPVQNNQSGRYLFDRDFFLSVPFGMKGKRRMDGIKDGSGKQGKMGTMM
jgi:hypothetical protein